MKEELIVFENTNLSEILKIDFQVLKNVNDFEFQDFEKISLPSIFLIEANLPNESINILESFKTKIIGRNLRFLKQEQYRVLKNFDILTPETFYPNKKITSDFLTRIFFNFKDIAKGEQLFVFKMDSGVRGIGQTLLTKKEAFDFYIFLFEKEIGLRIPENKRGFIKIEKNNETNIYKTEYHEGIKKFKPKEDSESNSEELIRAFKNNSIIIQPFIKKKREFRYLFFYGLEPIIIERTFSDENWQSNASINGEVLGKVSQKIIPYSLHKKIENLCLHYKYPFLSLDVYEDMDGNFGIFEFQQEFAHNFVENKNELCEKMNRSVSNLLSYV